MSLEGREGEDRGGREGSGDLLSVYPPFPPHPTTGETWISAASSTAAARTTTKRSGMDVIPPRTEAVVAGAETGSGGEARLSGKEIKSSARIPETKGQPFSVESGKSMLGTPLSRLPASEEGQARRRAGSDRDIHGWSLSRAFFRILLFVSDAVLVVKLVKSSAGPIENLRLYRSAKKNRAAKRLAAADCRRLL